MSESFEDLIKHVNAAWNFNDRTYNNYPIGIIVAQQEFELRHCANHIGAATGQIHAQLERIDHEGLDEGRATTIAIAAAKLIAATLKLCSVIRAEPEVVISLIKHHAKS